MLGNKHIACLTNFQDTQISVCFEMPVPKIIRVFFLIETFLKSSQYLILSLFNKKIIILYIPIVQCFLSPPQVPAARINCAYFTLTSI